MKKFKVLLSAVLTSAIAAAPFVSSADIVKNNCFEDKENMESWVYDTAKIYKANPNSATVFSYEDFNKWSLDDTRKQFELGEQSVISKNMGFNSLPVGFKKFSAQVDDDKTISRHGTGEDSWLGFIGSKNKEGLIGQQFNPGAAVYCGNAPFLKPGNKDWVDFSGTVLVNCDYLIPNLDNVANDLGNMQIMHAQASVSWAQYLVCEMPTVYVTDGTVYASSKYSAAGVTSMSVDGAAPGDWVTLQTAITRDKDAGTTTIRQYVNGKLIGGNAVLTNKNTSYAYERTFPNGGGEDYHGLAILCSYRSQNDSDWHGIDNILLSVYEDTKVQPSAMAADGTAQVNVYNTAVADEYEGHITPDGAKKGYLNTDAAEITAVKYRADDPLMLDGEPVDGIRIENLKESKETFYPEAVTYGVSNDGSKITFANVPYISGNEKIKATIAGAEDVLGNKTDKTVLLYGNECTSVPFYDYEFNFYFSDESDVKVENGVYQIPASVAEMKFKTEDENGNMTISDDNGNNVMSVNPEYGMYDFIFTDMLSVGHNYSVLYNSEKLFDFFTVSSGFKCLTDATSDKVSFRYINSTDEDIDLYFVGAKFNADGKMIDIAGDSVVCNKRYQDYVESSKTLSGDGTNKVFLWQKNKMNVDSYSGRKLSVTLFNSDGKANVYGSLGTDFANKKADVLVLNKSGETVYATDVTTDKNGDYNTGIYINTSVCDTYTVYVRVDDTIYKKVKSFAASDKNSNALSELNKSASAEELEANIETYVEELEFDNEYKNSVNKSDVAHLLYTYIKSLPQGLDVNSKAAAVNAYNHCVVMQMFTQSKVDEIENVYEYINVLNTQPLNNWYSYRSDINEKYTDLWRGGIVSRMSGVSYTSINDFENKLVAAFTFSVVKDSGSMDMLISYLNDIADQASLDKSLIKYDVVSKIVGRDYTGFSYDTLKADMKNIDENNRENTKDSSKGGSTSSRKNTGSGSNVSIPGTDDKTIQPIPTETFGDMDNTEWAKEAVNALNKLGIVSGKGDNKFAPNDLVTREEFVKMIVNAASIQLDDKVKTFNDVAKDSWYYSFVNTAYNAGIVSGISETEFGSGLNITREDIAVMVYNALMYKKAVLNDEYDDFSDKDNISSYAVDAVSHLAGAKIINGYSDGTFLPSANATRAEAAKIIYGALDYLTVR